MSERPKYLKQLINSRLNGFPKVITGVRRCGKSYLLKELYYDYLISEGVDKNNIIILDLDEAANAYLRNPLKLNNFILSKCTDENLVSLITEFLSSDLYKSSDAGTIVRDTIKLVKKNKLNDQREKLMQRIRNYQVITDDDRKQLNTLLAQKFELDKQVQKLQK